MAGQADLVADVLAAIKEMAELRRPPASDCQAAVFA